MRLTEFTNQLTNLQRLDEVNMSPSSLKSLASKINARAGMEFEMCIPEVLGSRYEVTGQFSKVIGKQVNYSKAYHRDNTDRPNHENNFYLVEPDGSIKTSIDGDFGLEFVSPAMPVAEMISDLDKVVKWAETNGCYTNETTGLHINISVDNWSSQKGHLDYVKLVLLSGDQHILEEFNRQGNEYCYSALRNISNLSSRHNLSLFQEMKSGLNGLAQDIIGLGEIENTPVFTPKTAMSSLEPPGEIGWGYINSIPRRLSIQCLDM